VTLKLRVTIAGDENYDKKLIIDRFMEELCRRDNAVNRSEMQSDENTFTIKGIWSEVLSNSFPGEEGLEYVRKFVRDHEMEENSEIDIVVPSDKVALTDRGRTKCIDFEEE
jgi:hypothetical protein